MNLIKKNNSTVTGQQLVADYQSALISIATSNAADFEAKRSESELLDNLNSMSNGNYLNPVNIDQNFGENVARASLDTHIKKIQAEQIKTMSNTQLIETLSNDEKDFKGKRVKILSLNKDFQPFEALWFNDQTGYNPSIYKKKAIEGKIEELLIEKNALIIKPKILSRILVNDLKFFIVYVINPNTLEPAVSIELL